MRRTKQARIMDTTYQFFRQNNDKVCEVMIGRFGQFHKGWTNKMFVEAMFMPHQIEITNIRVERLQDLRHRQRSRQQRTCAGKQ